MSDDGHALLVLTAWSRFWGDQATTKSVHSDIFPTVHIDNGSVDLSGSPTSAMHNDFIGGDFAERRS